MQEQTSSNPPTQQVTPKEKKSSKLPLILLLLFTALLFGGLGVVGGKMLLCEEKTEATRQDCPYNDITYKDSTIFEADDDCNQCLCHNGKTICTNLNCKELASGNGNEPEIAEQEKILAVRKFEEEKAFAYIKYDSEHNIVIECESEKLKNELESILQPILAREELEYVTGSSDSETESTIVKKVKRGEDGYMNALADEILSSKLEIDETRIRAYLKE